MQESPVSYSPLSSDTPVLAEVRSGNFSHSNVMAFHIEATGAKELANTSFTPSSFRKGITPENSTLGTAFNDGLVSFIDNKTEMQAILAVDGIDVKMIQAIAMRARQEGINVTSVELSMAEGLVFCTFIIDSQGIDLATQYEKLLQQVNIPDQLHISIIGIN